VTIFRKRGWRRRPVCRLARRRTMTSSS